MSAAANPFDLKGRADAGPSRKYVAKNWTPAEQAELLVGYVEVPPENWTLIRANSHVRYYSTENEFRYGGFVRSNPFEYTPKGETDAKRYMRLSNSFDTAAQGTKAWMVGYEKMSRVFVKLDAVSAHIQSLLELAISKLNENNRKLAAFSKQLEQRIDALEKKAK